MGAAAQQEIIVPAQDEKVEGELSISLSEMLGLLGTLEEDETSETGQRFDAAVRENVRLAVRDKLRKYQNFFSFCEAQSAECKMEVERLRLRQKAIDNAKDRLRKYLAGAMEYHNVRRLDAGTVVFSLVAGRESLQITDESKIPGEFIEERIVVDIDKDKVKRALKAGEPVDGAQLVTGDPYVVAR